MGVWIWMLAAGWATDTLDHDRADQKDLLIVELIDTDAARGAELRCPSGHRDAGAFVYGRVVLRAPEEGCTLRFLDGEAQFGPTGPGELLCDLSGAAPDCLSVCDADSPAQR